MRIHAHLSAVHNIRGREYAVRFFFGGCVTAAAALIARKFGPIIGGLFLAFPAIFPASVTLLAKHEQEKKRQHGLDGTERGKIAAALDARGAAIGSCALFLFALTMWLSFATWTLGSSLFLSVGVWFVSSILIWRVRQMISTRL